MRTPHLNRFAFRAIQRALVEPLEDRQLLSSVGALDPTFGNNGTVTYPYQVDGAKVKAVAAQSDGKVVELLDGPKGLEVSRLKSDGSIDTGFGTQGIADLSKLNATGTAILVQTDGKIALLGLSNSRFLVARLTTSGKLDTSFNSTGSTLVFSGFASPTSIAQQSDGKLIVAGKAFHMLALARLKTNGMSDSTFGNFGTRTTDLSGSSDETINDIALQSDGKIVAVGTEKTSPQTMIVARYSTSGNLDKSFDGDGRVQLKDPNGSSGAQVAVQSDGKILAAGNLNSHTTIVRISSSGAIDKSFGTSGQATTVGPSDIKGLAIQTGSKIILATSLGVVRLNSNGSSDTSYGTSGVARIPMLSINSGDFGTLGGFAIQSDGKVLLGGYDDLPFTEQSVVARLTTSGKIDSTFGAGGRSATIGSGRSGQYNDVAVQSDGKIVAVGYALSLASGTIDFLIDRYNSNGTLDTTFGNGGRVMIDFGQGRDEADSVSVAGGKIIVTGDAYSTTDSANEIGIVRLNSNGTLDTSFNGTGIKIQSVDGEIGPVVGAVQTDGSIVVGTETNPNGSSEVGIVERFTQSGALDTSFADHGTFTLSLDLDFSYPSGSSRKILIQPNGQILVAGEGYAQAAPFADFHVEFGVVRLNVNGSLDSSFGDGGKAHFIVNGYVPQLKDAALLSDGRIVLAGEGGSGYYTGIALLLSKTGGLISTYQADHIVEGVAVAPNGQIVLSTQPNTLDTPQAIVLNNNLSYANSFESPGGAVAAQADGNFVFAAGTQSLDAPAQAFLPSPLLQRFFGANATPPFAQLLSNGTLFVTGTDAADTISISKTASGIVATVNGSSMTFSTSAVKNIYATAVGGNDVVHNNTALASTMIGGDGNDALFGGSGNDALDGSAGNDFLSGLSGNDSMQGGDGNDVMDGGLGNDTFAGGNGNDTADYHFRTENLALVVDFNNFGESGAVGTSEADLIQSDIETLIGGSGNDIIQNTTSAPLLLVGNAGNDTLLAGSGNDTLDGGAGRDSMIGGAGNNTFLAKDGEVDTLDGDGGSDTASSDSSSSVKDLVSNIESIS